MSEFMKAFKQFIEAFAPALAVMFWNYEESKVQIEKNKAFDAEIKFELEKNHEFVDKKNAGKSDLDIVRDAAKGRGTK